MLRVGLSGGIGSGKSTVARRLAELGAVVVDADVMAREVVDLGTPGLQEVRKRFGVEVIGADGGLDRAALGRLVFTDAAARKDLESIIHPLIAARTRQSFAEAPREAVVVHDIPLLVELDRAADYHLTVIVGASEQVRQERLVGDRGMSREDALSRIAAQATDAQRRAAADVWIPNEGSRAALTAAVDDCWSLRIAPFNDNLLTGARSHLPAPVIEAYDGTWPAQAARLTARIGAALGERAVDIAHIGSTSVPGLAAKNVIDLQVGVRRLADADDAGFVEAMAAQGFPRVAHITSDSPKASMPDPAAWAKRFHGSADPGRVVHVHVREAGSAGQRFALLFRDWLRDNPAERAAYEQEKRRLAAQSSSTTEYAAAKEPWFDDAFARVEAWARR
ncbi:dephospho-CoA kinase [Leekyejoonella antrihumi]|uniref:Dephospho-CoA kinase n=1 Tax=Leekyejoonella antrihumi TaxID=1660198 RepID=A0A563E4H7_9MICO|nr:dephospho-CoA kinase [Leekyejoonella antrihumi]TWP37142.1 dephospho-CoA kinase [Leekyejoonella antrihumi]